MSVEAEVLTETQGGLGVITLNRPKALNALSLGMIEVIEAALARWAGDDKIAAVLIRGAGEKAFCAGGDVRAIATVDGSPETERLKRLFFAAEYRLNYHIHTYPKPFLALIDGITMGGGCGLSLHGSHVIATERTALAMPETVLGLFPDVGATWFLNRLPGEMGVYLGLSGVRLRANDLVALGMATHFVPSAAAPALIEDLAATPLDEASIAAVLARHAGDPGAAMVATRRSEVDKLFAGATVEAIMADLGDAGPDWAGAALQTMHRASPTSLKLTLRQLRGGRTLNLAQMLRIEYRLAVRCTTGHDFPEGVRAILIDKDNAPRWQPARLEDLDAASVEAYFWPFAEPRDELDL
ncbi:MAG: enoyl-CoA hydratase [Aliidongia sp.]|nr:enoyl-CoA hydratase [Aliidongia sp.]